MLFAICADRGAPGSTTAALALAAARGLPAVVVEADPYGGDLALRLRRNGNPLPSTPTVLSVGAGRSSRWSERGSPQGSAHESAHGSVHGPTRSRTGSTAPTERRHRDLWRDGTHQMTQYVRVVPGFAAAEHGTSLAWPVLASALEGQTVPVFADLGRIHTGSPSLPIAAAADALIPVCRNDVASVQHLVDRLELLVPAIAERKGRPPIVLPLVIAPRQHASTIANSVAEILAETAVGPTLRGVSWLAWDPAGVAQLESGADPWARLLRKSPLMTSARKVMWMVGLATGLSHADPSADNSRQSFRRRRDRGEPTDDEPKSWALPYVEPLKPDQHPEQHPSQHPDQQLDPSDQSPPPSPPRPSSLPLVRSAAETPSCGTTPPTPASPAAAAPVWTPRPSAREPLRNGTLADPTGVVERDDATHGRAHGQPNQQTNGHVVDLEARLGRSDNTARGGWHS